MLASIVKIASTSGVRRRLAGNVGAAETTGDTGSSGLRTETGSCRRDPPKTAASATVAWAGRAASGLFTLLPTNRALRHDKRRHRNAD